jgi:hypothetical protein
LKVDALDVMRRARPHRQLMEEGADVRRLSARDSVVELCTREPADRCSPNLGSRAEVMATLCGCCARADRQALDAQLAQQLIFVEVRVVEAVF